MEKVYRIWYKKRGSAIMNQVLYSTTITAKNRLEACKAARQEFNKDSHYTVVKVVRERM